MKRTVLGKTGLSVSRLGFGCMRLPMTAEGKVDREKSIPLLQKAVDLGVNYFDTAIFYCNGDSQRVLGEAMQDRRDRVVLSTKNHMHESPADAWWARLEESLRLLRTDCIDVYNMHGMTWATWTKHIDTPNGKLKLLQKALDQKMIRHIGCSFHDSAEALVKLGETGVIESVTLQYNLLNRELHDAISRLRELNVGVVVMGPVGGGRLGVDSERIRQLTGHRVQSTPEAALRFVLAHPGVCVALSGMSTLEMVQQNVRTVSEQEPFTAGEIAQIDAEVNRIREKSCIPCTGCAYCLPCPFGVQIPGNFDTYNQYRIYGLKEHAQGAYAGLSGPAVRCVECGACLPKCPQKIEIPAMLRKVTGELDQQFHGFGAMLSVAGVKGEGIQGRITVKNLTEKALSPVVSVALADGAVCEPPSFRIDTLAAGSAVSRNVTILAPDGVGVIEGNLGAEAGGESRVTPIRIPFFFIPRDTVRWHQAKLAAKRYSGRQDIVDTHGYRVGLRHDDGKVYVVLEVRSKLHALARPGESGGGRIELYVDMRPAENGFARAPYSDGAEQFFVSLGAAGQGSQSGKIYQLNQRNEKTPDGVRVTLELPFDQFLKPDWPKPQGMGLDFMFVVCDPDGTELGHSTYGGRGGLYQNPAGFTAAVLL